VRLAAADLIKSVASDRDVARRHHAHRLRTDRREGGVTETDCAALLDAAHKQLGPLVVVWDTLNVHVSDAMTGLIVARN
jgi:hypothetical protein